MNETVQPSPVPDSATATGTGGSSSGATPPPPSQSAGTSGLGPQTDQHGEPPSGGDAPLHLSEGAVADDQEPQSPSGT